MLSAQRSHFDLFACPTSVSRSVSHSVSHSVSYSVPHSVYQSVSHSVSRSVYHSVSHSVSLLFNTRHIAPLAFSLCTYMVWF